MCVYCSVLYACLSVGKAVATGAALAHRGPFIQSGAPLSSLHRNPRYWCADVCFVVNEQEMVLDGSTKRTGLFFSPIYFHNDVGKVVYTEDVVSLKENN